MKIKELIALIEKGGWLQVRQKGSHRQFDKFKPINDTFGHAENIVARLRQSVEKHTQEAKRGYDITFSHGIMEFNPERQHTIKTVLADGDSLMYALKKSKG